jgi:hypothetical protein
LVRYFGRAAENMLCAVQSLVHVLAAMAPCTRLYGFLGCQLARSQRLTGRQPLSRCAPQAHCLSCREPMGLISNSHMSNQQAQGCIVRASGVACMCAAAATSPP